MKIVLLGLGGQGIQFLGRTLAKILTNLRYNVVLTNEYDAFVQASKSESYLIFSKEKIENPIIDKADLTYDLKNKNLQNKLLKAYDNKNVMNVVLLGMILKKLNFKLDLDKIKKYFPKRWLKENLKAVKIGFELN